jgi:hypothetical protein
MTINFCAALKIWKFSILALDEIGHPWSRLNARDFEFSTPRHSMQNVKWKTQVM